MKKLFACFLVCGIIYTSCDSKKEDRKSTLDDISVKYLKLGLEIGQYDSDFVDAYYGPDSLKPAPVTDTVLPKAKFLARIDSLLAEVRAYRSSIKETDSFFQRANYMEQQLIAFGRRIRIFSGERETFDREASEVFNVNVPTRTEEDFKKIISELEDIVPGSGPLDARLDALNKKFIIPKDKVDTVFRLAIAEARKRTIQKMSLPANESFTLEYVTGKPWSGYNWYKGKYNSLIQINTDLPIMIDRAIDLACHEGYPGHHVYNMMLEKNLYNDKGWKEISLYPLFSPQSFIAEGSANYGIEMAFPGDEKIKFTNDVLLPAAGLDSAGLTAYLRTIEIKVELNFARNEVARGLIDKKINEQQAIDWLVKYNLASPASAAKSLSFIKKYGSYVICYNYGQDLVKHYIETAGSDMQKRWELFSKLLSNPITPGELEAAWNPTK